MVISISTRFRRAGGEEKQLTAAKGLDDGPNILLTGNNYFNSERTGHMQIWRMRADGSEQDQIYVWRGTIGFRTFSPDGEQMVFLTYDASVKGHPENKDVMLRMMTLKDKKITVLAEIVWRPGTMKRAVVVAPREQFAFVSYQWCRRPSDSWPVIRVPWKRKPLRSSSLLLYGCERVLLPRGSFKIESSARFLVNNNLAHPMFL